MPGLYYLSVTLHVLAALLWLGGMFFLGAVGAPALRKVEPPPVRQRLFHELGVRFRNVGWISIAVLVVTGLVNLHYRGLLRWQGVLGEASFWGTGTGTALAFKLGTVLFMISAAAIHDFVLGPAAGRIPPGAPEGIAMRRRATLMARANTLVGVVLVIAAVRLARGG